MVNAISVQQNHLKRLSDLSTILTSELNIESLIEILLNNLKDIVSSTTLDKEQFYTIGNFFENKNGTFVWDNLTNIIPPPNILLHHANYVVGVSNKINLLKMIKSNEGMV